jgi:CelD/BcsL family acetyltransferase involved in cellulose biosynthesis
MTVTGATTLTRPAGPLRADVFDRLEPLREDWMRLAAASRNVFASWEWNELWWRHFGRGRALRVAVSQRDDEIDAIVPLFQWSRRPFRILRLIGHGHGDLLGPICRHDDAETSAQALRHALAAERYDVFVGDWVAGDRAWAGVLGGRVVRRTGYPILHFQHGSWDEFLASQSQTFRKRARHRRNRLTRDHNLSYRYADAATLEHDLDAVFRLHRARFGEHRCHFCGEHEAFQREFAGLALERGWLRLLLLEVDGEPVCSEYGFVFQDAYFSYQGGRDPAWGRESVGFLLELESIRLALEEGAVEYRFLGGEEEYKYRFATEDPRLETVAVPATARGRIAAAAMRTAWRNPVGEAVLRRIGSARASD